MCLVRLLFILVEVLIHIAMKAWVLTAWTLRHPLGAIIRVVLRCRKEAMQTILLQVLH